MNPTENQLPDVVVNVQNLVKTFRDFWYRPKVHAVHMVDLSVSRGEVFGLLGPNGSGKSTIIKTILGLLRPSSGSVVVLQKPPSDVATKRNIGYLPEESYLYKFLTPRETLDFYAQLFHMKSSERKNRIEQLLDMVGLSHAADRPVGEFSKGMARRIGLAQALINDPELIVLDEPTSGLDPIGCRQMKDLLLTLAARGKTIILSSHLLADVEDVCNRVAILYNGEIQACGRVSELLEEQESVRLTFPSLPADRMNSLLQTLRKKYEREPGIDHPSMNLEQFFLQVVEHAHRTTERRPSGVSKTDGVAGYLKKTQGS